MRAIYENIESQEGFYRYIPELNLAMFGKKSSSLRIFPDPVRKGEQKNRVKSMIQPFFKKSWQFLGLIISKNTIQIIHFSSHIRSFQRRARR